MRWRRLGGSSDLGEPREKMPAAGIAKVGRSETGQKSGDSSHGRGSSLAGLAAPELGCGSADQ